MRSSRCVLSSDNVWVRLARDQVSKRKVQEKSLVDRCFFFSHTGCLYARCAHSLRRGVWIVSTTQLRSPTLPVLSIASFPQDPKTISSTSQRPPIDLRMYDHPHIRQGQH